MLDMYKGMINSPETTITNNINESDTIIYVLDPARVPEPPNLMTLGTGTNAETVKVLEINDNAITVERGFQGVAKSWPAGTVIARNFTEYDYNALKENIEDLEATKETPQGAQEKADAALNSAKQYTDQEVGEVAQELAAHKAESASHKKIIISEDDPDASLDWDLWFTVAKKILFNEAFNGANGAEWDSTRWATTVLISAAAGSGATIQNNAGQLKAIAIDTSTNAIVQKRTANKIIDFTSKEAIVEFEVNDYQQIASSSTNFNLAIVPTIPSGLVFNENNWIRFNIVYDSQSIPGSGRGIIVNKKNNGDIFGLYVEERPVDNGLVKYRFVFTNANIVKFDRWDGSSWTNLMSVNNANLQFSQAYLIMEQVTKETAGSSRLVDNIKVY